MQIDLPENENIADENFVVESPTVVSMSNLVPDTSISGFLRIKVYQTFSFDLQLGAPDHVPHKKEAHGFFYKPQYFSSSFSWLYYDKMRM